jgi:hypothetical protein
MLQMGGESKTDGNDDEDAVVVAFVNAVVILTCCGGGLFVPMLEQILEVVTFFNEVVYDAIDSLKCGVGVLVFMVLLVVVAGVALHSRFVACGR